MAESAAPKEFDGKELTYDPENGVEVKPGGKGFCITVPGEGFDVPLRFRRHDDVEDDTAVVESDDGTYSQSRKFSDGYEDGDDIILIFSGIEVGKKYQLKIEQPDDEPFWAARNIEAREKDIRDVWESELSPKDDPDSIDLSDEQAAAQAKTGSDDATDGTSGGG